MKYDTYNDIDDEDAFEQEYDAIFDGEDAQVDADVDEFEGRTHTKKRPALSALNKSKLTKHEMDEVFL